MKPKVLFVCVENACRSQMAEGFARLYGSGMIHAYSAGSRPAPRVNPDAVHVMSEIKVDIGKQSPKAIVDVLGHNVDYIVSMGCGDACPRLPGTIHIEWKIPDPKGKDLDFFRDVRDLIAMRVRELIIDITPPTTQRRRHAETF